MNKQGRMYLSQLYSPKVIPNSRTLLKTSKINKKNMFGDNLPKNAWLKNKKKIKCNNSPEVHESDRRYGVRLFCRNYIHMSFVFF